MTNEEKAEYLARQRAAMTVVVTELRKRVGVEDAVGTLLGAAVALLEAQGGPALAAKFLRSLADGVEANERPQWVDRN